jgi:hypothetical protein
MLRLGLKRPKETVVGRADRARDAGRWEEAARLYRVALDRNPANPPIWVQYGHALKEAGSLQAAEQAYRSAIGCDPHDADACLQLGHVLKLQGRADEAQSMYLRAAALDPSLPDPRRELAAGGWHAACLAELDRMLPGRAADGLPGGLGAPAALPAATDAGGRRSRPAIAVRLVAPTEWANVYPNSQVVVRGVTPGIAVEARVMPQGDAPAGERRPVQHVALQAAGRDLAAGRLGNLAPGAYTIELTANGFLADAAAFRVRGAACGAWRAAFAAALAKRHPVASRGGAGSPPLFSLTTTIYDTDPVFLSELADDIRFQACGDFEWLLLDNGSRDPAVVAAINEIARSDRRFRHFRVERNIHIIPGNRYLLERAQGRYIVPIDSDDRVSSHALAVIERELRRHDMPDVLFSDEAKVDVLADPIEYIWRPRYSRLAALATCPAAHLQVFRRDLGLAQGAYSDAYAQGSHDWDTLMRLTDAGARVCSTHECLYGWRAHPLSAAQTEQAKDYIISSQQGVIEHSLVRRRLDRRFRVEPARPGAAGAFRVRRQPVDPQPVEIDLVLNDAADVATIERSLVACRYPAVGRLRIIDRAGLMPPECDTLARAAIGQGLPAPDIVAAGSTGAVAGLLGDCRPGSFAKLIVNGSVDIATPDWIWEAVGALELDDQVGVVGGALLAAETDDVLHLGWAVDPRLLAVPLGAGRKLSQTNRGLLRQPVSAVWGGLAAIRTATIARVGPPAGMDDAGGLFGLEYGLRCRRHDIETVLDPFIVARLPHAGMTFGRCDEQAAAIRRNYADLLDADPYVGPIEIAETAVASGAGNGAPGEGVPAAQPGCRVAAVTALPLLHAMGPARPLNLVLSPDLECRPTLNLLLPAVRMISMSGGPNTALGLAYRMAMAGVPVRLISSDHKLETDGAAVRRHILDLCGEREWLPIVEICDAADRDRPLQIGRRDIFLATAWWTARMAMHQLPRMAVARFFYLIQDYEPVLHPGSSLQAMAQATYDADYVPIVNHPLLHRFLAEHRVGRFAEPDFAAHAMVLTPAIDRRLFRPRERARRAGERRRLLFYARPTTALRNLFEIGVLALHLAATRGVFDAEPWEFCGMGDNFEPIALSPRHELRPLPWVDMAGYARQMREADLLLSLMLSPHPSYPPLEMAACGGLVVTNTYATKTAERLAAVSPNILAAEPDVEPVADMLARAVGQLRDHAYSAALRDHPAEWSDSLAPVVAGLLRHWRALLAGSGD